MNRRVSAFAVSLFALLVGVCAGHAAGPNWIIPEGIKTVQVNGYHMAYQETGASTPVVLVHGSLSDYRLWRLQVPELAKTNRIFALSLRHYYPEKWDGRGDDFSVTQHAHDVAAFIRALQLGKVHLVGHSRGGAVVLNTARHHPDVIRTLTLMDASGLEALLPDTPEGQKRAAEGLALRKKLNEDYLSGDFEKAAREFIDALAPGTWAKFTPAGKQVVLDNLGTALVVEGRPTLTCEQIGQFGFPIFLVTGEKSPKRYGEMFAAMRRCGKAPEPVVIPNAGHIMQTQNPGAFNTALTEFLGRH
jgi:pimeloyl-ACP methyl ester carboxylesterase